MRMTLASVRRIAIRRKRCEEAYATRCLERLKRLPIAIDDQTDAHAWGATRVLALKHDLTVYDAAYLELAIRRKQPLASCDAALIRAGKKVGLDVLCDWAFARPQQNLAPTPFSEFLLARTRFQGHKVDDVVATDLFNPSEVQPYHQPNGIEGPSLPSRRRYPVSRPQ